MKISQIRSTKMPSKTTQLTNINPVNKQVQFTGNNKTKALAVIVAGVMNLLSSCHGAYDSELKTLFHATDKELAGVFSPSVEDLTYIDRLYIIKEDFKGQFSLKHLQEIIKAKLKERYKSGKDSNTIIVSHDESRRIGYVKNKFWGGRNPVYADFEVTDTYSDLNFRIKNVIMEGFQKDTINPKLSDFDVDVWGKLDKTEVKSSTDEIEE